MVLSDPYTYKGGPGWIEQLYPEEFKEAHPEARGQLKGKNMRLTLRIKRVGNIIFGQVADQETGEIEGRSLVCGGRVVKRIVMREGPALTDDCLYVRGAFSHYDNSWFAHSYPHRDIAIQAMEDIIMLVSKINTGGPQVETDDHGLEIID